MQSKNSPERLDLSRVPTTEADVAALESVRKLDRLDATRYVEFLRDFSDRHPPTREIPPRHEPFVL